LTVYQIGPRVRAITILGSLAFATQCDDLSAFVGAGDTCEKKPRRGGAEFAKADRGNRQPYLL